MSAASQPGPIGIQWVHREPPLAIAGVMAHGAAARLLLHRLASAEIDPLVRVSTTAGTVVAVGPEQALPWVEGVTWLGRAGPIFTPTTLQTDIAPTLLARSIARHGAAGIIVVTPDITVVSHLPATPPPAEALTALAERMPTE